MPVGAIILVALGTLFLLSTAGVLNVHWISHGWPLILIAVGIWIFYSNSRKYPGGPK